MNKQDLEAYIRQYTALELEYLHSGSVSVCEDGKCGELVGDGYLIRSSRFMRSGNKFAVNRQERFQDVRLHKHDFIELCYVWSGSCEQTIEGKKVITSEGDVCIFDTHVSHAVKAAGENDILVNIMMQEDFFNSAFLSRMTRQGIVTEFLVDAVTSSRQKKHYLYFSTHRNPRVRELMEHIVMEYRSNDIGMEEIISSYIIILFTELLRTWRDTSREQESSGQDVQILEILAYIEEHYETCTLPEVGKAFGIHGNYLTALLKEKTGRSFLGHVQEQKLRKAKSLLENTEIPMAELVPMCGYNNVHFFYKKFKESEGCTPAEYRKNHRNTVETGELQP